MSVAPVALLTRVQITTLVLSGSPLATPCKNAALAAESGASPTWLQATGNSYVDETPISASLRVYVLAILHSVAPVIPEFPNPAVNLELNGPTIHYAPCQQTVWSLR